ncbi:ABC transporter permease, partial [Acidimicrobiaceae bacterium AH-315-P05]|nr:ABC transporter permease [Acidimicrobiaceae bacterium AH-315-P05]
LLAVSALTFFMVQLLPGDPVDLKIPPEAQQDQEAVARIREELGLNRPVIVQYASWLGDITTGDLGNSYITDQPVINIMRERLPITLELAAVAIIFAVVLAIPLGVLSAYKQGRAPDKLISAGLQMGLSIPNFVVGVFVIWLFAEKLGWFPATGWTRLTDSVTGNIKGVVLPAFSLALIDLAVFSRLVRSDMISTLEENYILSAKAKGMSDGYILFRHALRPSSLSLVTIVALNLGGLIGGTVVIEQLFAMGGIGRQLIDSILRRDYIVIQGITVFIATVYVVLNTMVDFVYLAIDPRIRAGKS